MAKIYIAGKITGLDYQTAFDLFEDADHSISLMGHEPINPMDEVNQADGRTYNEYLHEALWHCLEADAVFMLSNWRDSTGARIEHAIAEIMGKPIFYQASDF